MDTKALRQKILDLAIRGKLVPQDPNDEPASVLLERIRAEKQQMVKDGKLKPKDIKNDTIIFVGEDNLHYEKFQDGTVKCIEDEIPFEVPEGWGWCRLASICSLISDIDHKMPKAVDDGVLFLSAKDLLNDGTINYTDDVKMISEEDFFRLSKKALPQKNDIIYSRIGACLGKARVVTKDIRFIVSYSCCTIRPVIIDSTFLASILDGNFVLDQAKDGTQSVGVPDLGMASIKQFLIPIPPLTEQHRIDERLQYALNIVQKIAAGRNDLILAVSQTKSKILDLAIRGQLVPQNPDDEPASVLLERIRTEKEELIKAGKIKRDKKESIIFRGEDNSYYETISNNTICIDEEVPFDLPDGWIWCRLKSLADPHENSFVDGPFGSNLKTDHYTDRREVRIIQLNNIGEFTWKNNGIKYTTYSHAETLSRCKSYPGDIVIAKMMPAGRAIIIPDIEDVYVISSDCVRLQLPNYIDKRYVMYMINSPTINKSVMKNVQGIGRTRTSLSKLKELLVPIPPYKQQCQISATFDKSLFYFDTINALCE